MRLFMYSVMDSKVGAFMTPFFLRSDGEAIRAFSHSVSDANTQFSKTPEDFTLYRHGEFDDQTGEMVPTVPSVLVTALQVQLPKAEAELPMFQEKDQAQCAQ